jgi:hypothetical protein
MNDSTDEGDLEVRWSHIGTQCVQANEAAARSFTI